MKAIDEPDDPLIASVIAGLIAKYDRLTIKPEEAFRIAGIGREHGYRLLHRGEFPVLASAAGRTCRVPIVGLVRWIARAKKC